MRFALILGLTFLAPAQGPVPVLPRETRLTAKIREESARLKADVFVFAKNTDSGASYAWRADERVPTASTFKLPILTALYDKVSKSEVDWKDTAELNAATRTGGSGVLKDLSDGLRMPFRDLATLMIIISDNTATNMILDRIGSESVNLFMDSLGLTKTRVLHKLTGGDPKRLSGFSKAGLLDENRRFGVGMSTSRDMVTLLELLANGKVVSPDASKEMLVLMERQQDKRGIGRRITPREATVASKSGWLNNLRSDVGVVVTQNGRIAMAISVVGLGPTQNNSEDSPALMLIAEVARELYEMLRG